MNSKQSRLCDFRLRHHRRLAGELLLLVSLDNEVGLGVGSAGEHVACGDLVVVEEAGVRLADALLLRLVQDVRVVGAHDVELAFGGDQLDVVRGPASTPNSDRPAFCSVENPTLALLWRRAQGVLRAAPGRAAVAEAAAMETGVERGDGLRSAAKYRKAGGRDGVCQVDLILTRGNMSMDDI
ncbi:hypothetical protein BHE74_00048668 [Ensete ventricosum]|nr:hypothetical protein BHE74_00048668 [Ensete ventricosum]